MTRSVAAGRPVPQTGEPDLAAPDADATDGGGPAVAASDIADPALAAAGRERIGWASRTMPVLGLLEVRHAAEQPFAGRVVAACLQLTAETAGLVGLLTAGGARVRLAASNPLSTQDDIAAALAAMPGVTVFGRAGVDSGTYHANLHRVLDGPPDLVFDDGGDLVNTLHGDPGLAASVLGGCEATSTGVARLRRMAAAGTLAFPVIAADASVTRRMFDNGYGTGQSVLDGMIRATNMLIAGQVVVVAGYGPCGSAVAERAAGLGAQVIVTEADPVAALRALMAGFRVLPMAEAAPLGDVFITATGSRDVVTGAHFAVMRDGAVLANAGHFDVEIDVPALADQAVRVRRGVRAHADEFTVPGGRRLILLAQGRVVNLVAAEGNPASVMDLTFAAQALALHWLISAGPKPPGVYPVPPEIDTEVASLALAARGARTDELTAAQREYLESWGQRG